MPTEDGYLLDNRQAEAGRRFDMIAELFDPPTFRHIDALGIEPGWRCWEVGAGGASVPDWLATRGAPGGRVAASDIDTSWLGGGGRVQVQQPDVGAGGPPPRPVDLVHAP